MSHTGCYRWTYKGHKTQTKEGSLGEQISQLRLQLIEHKVHARYLILRGENNGELVWPSSRKGTKNNKPPSRNKKLLAGGINSSLEDRENVTSKISLIYILKIVHEFRSRIKSQVIKTKVLWARLQRWEILRYVRETARVVLGWAVGRARGWMLKDLGEMDHVLWRIGWGGQMAGTAL